MPHRVRRVVTGHDATGRSTIIFDDLAPNVMPLPLPGAVVTDAWETTTSPADNTGDADAAERPITLEPPATGSLLRIVEFPPDRMWMGTDTSGVFDAMGGGHAKDACSADSLRHKTNTIDYLVVLKGEIYLVLDTGETVLRVGDILVQRGTVHSWSVRGDTPCIAAVVMIGARPYKQASPAILGG
jgi:mannose-6-phosphate isomerase-like protein (cupin superfamily)